MPRLPAPRREDMSAFEPLFRSIEEVMGFVPNSLLTMARRPDMLSALMALWNTVFGADTGIDPGLKQLIAHVASRAAGCRYCAAHTAHSARRAGVDVARIEAVWDYETSPLFGEDERAALTLAQRAALVPNAVTDADFDRLRAHFDDDQILEVTGVIAVFGFLNRWNDTLATEIEAAPWQFGARHLAASGWSAGKHAVNASDDSQEGSET